MNLQSCIDACLQCMLDCERCLAGMSGMTSHNECPRSCRECADICHSCALAMARGSRYIRHYCSLCAEICDWCAEQCLSHPHAHCVRCAESCRECAEECREVVAELAMEY